VSFFAVCASERSLALGRILRVAARRLVSDLSAARPAALSDLCRAVFVDVRTFQSYHRNEISELIK
jgi:hypothetical protein